MHKVSRIVMPLVLTVAAFQAYAHTTELKGCSAKKADVQSQLEHAEANNNKTKVAKLKIAQKNLNANCTDEGLRKEREADIRKKEQKVAERQEELDKAKAKGDNKKAAKSEKKLREAELELKDVQTELNK